MEGPSIVLLKDELKPFMRKKVLRISGNSKEPLQKLKGQSLQKIITWGKTIYLIFSGGIVTRTHFLMFGSFRINDPRENRFPRVQFEFANGILYFYACAFSMDAREQLETVDQRINVLSDDWDEKHVLELLKQQKDEYLCDVLLDQNLFAGAGNIVKNEVLFNLRRYPLVRVSDIQPRSLRLVVKAVRAYCENFYEWKKFFELRRHWQVYKRRNCRVCGTATKREHMGKGKRSTFYCPVCQSKKLTREKLVLHKVLPIAKGGKKEKRLDH